MNSTPVQIIIKCIVASIMLFFGGLFIFHHNISIERIYTYFPFSWQFASAFCRLLIAAYMFYGATLVFKKIGPKTKFIYASLFLFLLLDYFLVSYLHNSLPLLGAFSPINVSLICGSGIMFSMLLQPSQRLVKIKLPEILLAIGALVWVLLVNPPQAWHYQMEASDYDLESFPIEEFNKYDSLGVANTDDVLVAFFSTTCPHCMEKARRLSIMFGNDSKHLYCYFPVGNNDSTMNVFFEKNGGIHLNFQYYPARPFINVIQGGLPHIFRFKDGQPVEEFSGKGLTLKTFDYFDKLYD